MVKIHGTLIASAPTDPVCRAQVKTINEIAHAMGLTTVANGVENDEAAKVLRDIGVDGLQGNLLGAPRLLSELLKSPSHSP